MIAKDTLTELYLKDGLSVKQISAKLQCSSNSVTYWMNKHDIERRSISEAIYKRHNPHGDPFLIKPIRSRADAELRGLGIGLYWGEGTKANQHSVRLGNSDPALLRAFMDFLTRLYGVKREDFKFSLQLFSDTDPTEAMAYWLEELGVKPSQFYKTTVTISGSVGTYRHKKTRGVVTVYYHNKKLRDILVDMLPR